MVGFWEALESSKKTEAHFGRERQLRFSEARANARAFYDEMRRNFDRLNGLGVDAVLKEQSVSFKKGSLELLVVLFGTFDGTENRIFSPVIEYLKLTPSVQDLSARDDISGPAGEWLGRSLEVVERHRDRFEALGLS